MRGGIWEIIIIVLLVLVLFGSAKIPAMMRNLANGVKTFKEEVKEKPTTKKQTKAIKKKTTKK